jgi:hypothetical protein
MQPSSTILGTMCDLETSNQQLMHIRIHTIIDKKHLCIHAHQYFLTYSLAHTCKRCMPSFNKYFTPPDDGKSVSLHDFQRRKTETSLPREMLEAKIKTKSTHSMLRSAQLISGCSEFQQHRQMYTHACLLLCYLCLFHFVCVWE